MKINKGNTRKICISGFLLRFFCLFVWLFLFFCFCFFLSVLTRFNWSRTALSETSNGHSRIGKLDKNETIWVSIKKCGNIQGRSTQINLGMGLKHRGDIRLQILLFRLLKDRLIQLFSPQYNKNKTVSILTFAAAVRETLNSTEGLPVRSVFCIMPFTTFTTI